MLEAQPELYFFILTAFAAVLGGLIGFEREIDGHSAGLRTHIFIAATSAALVLLGTEFSEVYSSSMEGGELRTDPLRIVDAIIVGVSFIGAGVILKDERGKQVRNLTTAASILFTTVIGISVGLQMVYLAIALTGLALVINYFLLQLEKRLNFEDRD